MKNLNPAQLEAVLHIDGPLLINAGAGSGKTHTVTERVVYMIEEKRIDPRSIFCVTFTNKAAKEMRERIAKRLGIRRKDKSISNKWTPHGRHVSLGQRFFSPNVYRSGRIWEGFRDL